MKYLFIIGVFLCNIMTLNAQDFFVQIAAFETPVEDSYFQDAGIPNVKMFKDRFHLYHYYIDDIANIEDAEAKQKEIQAKGFQYSRVVDVEAENALCESYCSNLGISIYEINKLKLSPIFFDYNSSVVQADYETILDQLYLILREYSHLKALLEGHTDSKGNALYNQKLSLARVRAVRAYLVNKGIPSYRIKTKVFGESSPIAINQQEGIDVPQGRELNRRVALILLGPNDETIYNITKKANVPSHLRYHIENDTAKKENNIEGPILVRDSN